MCVFYVPSENIILRHTPKAEMQNISSKLQAAITNVMIPFSSPSPFCLKSNSAGRITAELTGLKIQLDEEECFFLYINAYKTILEIRSIMYLNDDTRVLLTYNVSNNFSKFYPSKSPQIHGSSIR